MPGRKARTSRLLILLAIIFSLGCGWLFTQSSAIPSPIDEGSAPDVFVAEDVNASLPPATGENQILNDSIETNNEIKEEVLPTPTETPIPVPTEVPAVFETSPEAESGIWTASGSNWLFVVDGALYTGWLTDTDGKRYYLGSDGFMKTGWLELDEKKYYLDLDGIMQTGDVVIGQEIYHFNPDGTLSDQETKLLAEASETIVDPITEDPVAFTEDPDSLPIETTEPVIVPTETPAETVEPTVSPTEVPVETTEPTAAPTETPTVTAEPTVIPTEAPAETTEPTIAPTEVPEETVQAEPTKAPKKKKQNSNKKKKDPTPVPTAIPDRYVALTFDDGPTEYTGMILDLLEEADAKATFFMQGSHMEHNSDLISRIYSLGHELGNHAYTHFDLSQLNLTDSSAEVAGVDELLNSYLGVTTDVLRPPYGNMNSELAGTTKKPVILWSVDSQDDSLTDPALIVENILASVQDGDIILMHDTSEITVNAVKALLPAMEKEGYHFLTVKELADKNGIELLSGTTYSVLK